MDVAVIDWKDSKFEKDVLYEDFNAPQWIDFSNPDHPVDDEAWFCRPECNHPKTVEDFFRKNSPGSLKLQRSSSVYEIPKLVDRNQRDAALKNRGYPVKKDSRTLKQVQNSENHNPNFSTPPTHKFNSAKEMIKSSSEKNNHDENILSPKPSLLKSTLSAHNLFAGRDILNQVTEFCNELKRLAIRANANGEKEIAKKGQGMGILKESKNERKPLLEVKKEEFEEIEKQISVKKKLTVNQKIEESENIPISLNMKIVRSKDEERVLQIRTNPPSPQCFSANHETSKATPSKAFRLKPQERGLLQEMEGMGSKELKKEVKVKVKGNMTTPIQNEAKGLDVFWPCHQSLVIITSVETLPPPQEEITPENLLTSQGPLVHLERDLNPCLIHWPCHQSLVIITSVETLPPPQEETTPENHDLPFGKPRGTARAKALCREGFHRVKEKKGEKKGEKKEEKCGDDVE
ncbi:hypothetical protein R6Q57_020089 [Mikania cordata]